VRDLQPFVDTVTLAYRKEALNEAHPLSRRRDFVSHATIIFCWDGEVPSEVINLLQNSQSMLNDAPINLLNVDALRLNPEFADLIRERVLPRLILWRRG
jgi:threonyl-tRNA synthetase